MAATGDLGFTVKAQPIGLFETPIVRARLEGAESLIAALGEAIQAKRAGDPGIVRANHLGWHSDTDMTAWAGVPARMLSDAAIQLARRMTAYDGAAAEDYAWSVTMWANVAGPGAMHLGHVHPGVVWAAVFYVDMGGAGGQLFLEDPRFPMVAMRDEALRLVGVDGRPQGYEAGLTLQAGDLVVFPAWLRHGVRAVEGPGERISIAMNIDAFKKPPAANT